MARNAPPVPTTSTRSCDAELSSEGFDLPPHFMWDTRKYSLHKFPAWYNFGFQPRGWWTELRTFNCLDAAYYNSYLPKDARLLPTLMILFTALSSALAVSDACEVPLAIAGAFNALMCLFVAWRRPYRRPAETPITAVIFGLNCVLAFLRSQGVADAGASVFYAVIAVSLAGLVHQIISAIVEVFWVYDAQAAAYHDAVKYAETS